MHCPDCHRPNPDFFRSDIAYEECGLSDVTLQSIAQHRCPACATLLISIPRISDLHRAIGLALVRKTTRLTGSEIRFMRTLLALSHSGLGEHLGIDAEVLQDWEQADGRLPSPHEIALRELAAERLGGAPQIPADALRRGVECRPARIFAAYTGSEWSVKTLLGA